MAFPQPESGKDDPGEGDIPNHGGEIGEVFERAVDVDGDRQAQDEMKPAENRRLVTSFRME